MATIFQDSFTVGSDTALDAHTPDTGTSWTMVWQTGGTSKATCIASTDRCRVDATVANSGFLYSANATYSTADYEASCVVSAGFAGTNKGYLIVRMQDQENMYALRFETGATSTRMYKKVSGTWTALGSFQTDPAVGDTIKIRVSGTTLTYYYNGGLIDTQTDSDLSSAGKAGIGMGGGAELASSTDDLTNTSAIDDFLVADLVTGPAAPTSLSGTESSGNINLTWTDNASDETGFVLERKRGGGNYYQIATPAANATSASDTDVDPGYTYTYRIKAVNGGGSSTYATSSGVAMSGTKAWTAKIEAWVFPGQSDAQAELTDGRVLSSVKPEYGTLDTSGVFSSVTGSTNAYDDSAMTNNAKSHSVLPFFTVSAGRAGMAACVADGTKRTNTINGILSILSSTGFVGVELDWEGYGQWTSTEYTNYKSFVADLCTAVHAVGKKVTVCGPPIGDATEQGYYEWHYEDFESSTVDYICALAYDWNFDFGAGTAIAPTDRVRNVCLWMRSKITDLDRIVVGMPNYGYYGTTGGFSITNITKTQAAARTGYGGATRDTASEEMMFASGGVSTVYNDQTGITTKREIIEDEGIRYISVWHLGDNDWFTARTEPLDGVGSPVGLLVSLTQAALYHPSATQSATARIAKSLTTQQTSAARIQVTGSASQVAKTRITTAVSATQFAQSRISKSLSATQSAQSRISTTVTSTQVAGVYIVIPRSTTQTSTTRIQNTAVTKTQPALAHVQRIFGRDQNAIARIQETPSAIQTATSRVRATRTNTQPANARIRSFGSRSQNAIARIVYSPTKTQTANARVIKQTTKTQPATARIIVYAGTGAGSATGMLLAITTVTSGPTTKTQPANARIRSNVTSTISAKSRIVNAAVKTQPANASVRKINTATQTASAFITGDWTPAGFMLLWAQRQSYPRSTTQTATARIRVSPSMNTSAGMLAGITRNASDLTGYGIAHIYATARIIQVVAKTQPANARIRVTNSITQSANGRIRRNGAKTQNAIARIGFAALLTQPANARIVADLSRTQPATARIVKTGTVDQQADGRITKTLTSTQLANSTVINTAASTQLANARLQVVGLHGTPIGLLLAITHESIYGLAYQSASAYLTVNQSALQTATARVVNVQFTEQSADARIIEVRSVDQVAIARIAKLLVASQVSTARIRAVQSAEQTTDARIEQQLSANQPADAAINQTAFSEQPAIAAVENVAATEQTATARVQIEATASQQAIAQIQTVQEKNQTATARLRSTASAMQQATASIVRSDPIYGPPLNVMLIVPDPIEILLVVPDPIEIQLTAHQEH